MIATAKPIFLLLLALLSVGLSAAAQAKPDSQIVITIKRETGLACSPDYSAEIYADGTVVYHGIDCVKVVGMKRHKIDQARLKQLVSAFQRINYFSLKDGYEVDENGHSWTDSPRTTTSISWNGKYKKVVDYICPPKELVALEDLIDKLAGLYEYIGPL
jgi:hypothetical protein